MTVQTEDPAAKYIPVVQHILEICQQYTGLFKPKDDPLKIYHFCAAPDEFEWIGLKNDGKTIAYVAHDFGGAKERTVEEVARFLSEYERRGASAISPRHIWDNFARNLRPTLGRFLANRELKGLEAHLTFPEETPQPQAKQV